MKLSAITLLLFLLIACSKTGSGEDEGDESSGSSTSPSSSTGSCPASDSDGWSSNEPEAPTYWQSRYPSFVTEKDLRNQYFIEMFLKHSDPNSNRGVTRMTRNPSIYFASAYEGSASKPCIEALLKEAIETLSNGTLTPNFTSLSPDAEKIEPWIVLDTAPGSCRASSQVSGNEVISGTITCREESLVEGPHTLNHWRHPILHELAHVLGKVRHSGIISNIMSYNAFENTNTYQSYELAAWHLLYQVELGTGAEALIASGELREGDFAAAPIILSTSVNDPDIFSKPDYTGPIPSTTDVGHPGYVISILHMRGLYNYGCGHTHWNIPKVYFGSLEGSVDDYSATVAATEEGSLAREICHKLLVTVPVGAETGNLYIQTPDGRQSNVIDFTVRSDDFLFRLF